MKKAGECTILTRGLEKHTSSRGKRGAAITLSPKWFRYCEKAGGFPPTTASSGDEDTNGGRFVEIKLQLNLPFKNKTGDHTKRKKPKMKVINLKLVSVCASGKFEEQQCFQEFAADKLQSSKHSVAIGQDSNAQIGKCNEARDD